MSKKLTTFQKCKWLQRVVLTRAGEGLSYKNWDNEFVGENLRGLFEPRFMEKLKEVGEIQICNLTAAQMEELCFLPADAYKLSYHIPIWIWEFLPKIIKIRSTNGAMSELDRSTCDNDHRAGMLWYTIMPATEEEKEVQ